MAKRSWGPQFSATIFRLILHLDLSAKPSADVLCCQLVLKTMSKTALRNINFHKVAFKTPLPTKHSTFTIKQKQTICGAWHHMYTHTQVCSHLFSRKNFSKALYVTISINWEGTDCGQGQNGALWHFYQIRKVALEAENLRTYDDILIISLKARVSIYLAHVPVGRANPLYTSQLCRSTLGCGIWCMRTQYNSKANK